MIQKKENIIFAGYNRLFREGMNLLLSERFEMLAHAVSFADALTAMHTGELQIDLLIGDPGEIVSTEISAILDIRRQFPNTKIIALAPQVSQTMLDALLESGVGGILSNNISVAALMYSIEIVMLGDRICPATLSSNKGIALSAPSKTDTSHFGAQLSSRESQILCCLVDGLPNKSIAIRLGIAEATIKVHLKMLLRKLHVQNRTQAAIWGVGHGFQHIDDDGEAAFRRTTPLPGRELILPLVAA
jgi:two-component system nitrate/nitrite response regulator NarL